MRAATDLNWLVDAMIFTAYSPMPYHCEVNVDGMTIVWWRLRKTETRRRVEERENGQS